MCREPLRRMRRRVRVFLWFVVVKTQLRLQYGEAMS